MDEEAPQPSQRIASAAFLALMQQRLGELFSDPRLEQLRLADPTHPAVTRHDGIEQLRRAGELVGPLHERMLVDAMRHWLDMVTWIPDSAAHDVWAAIDDAATRRRLDAALRDRDQFEDTLAELFVLGWLRDTGVEADRVEAEGLSDIAVTVTEAPNPNVRVEVKRIHEGTGTRRIADVIAKANNQIKASDPDGGGVVFISLGLPLLPIVDDDELPWEIEMRVAEARRATRSQNSSVSAVVLMWDDFVTFGADPDPIGVLVGRRSVVVEHAAPVRELSLPRPCLDVRITAATRIQFARGDGVHQSRNSLLAELRVATIDGVDLGKRDHELDLAWTDGSGDAMPLRPSHVKRAFDRPDAVVVHNDLGGERAIITRHVRTRDRELLLVLCARRFAPHARWSVNGGYQLFDASEVLQRLARDPNEAFAEVLIRYGNRFRIGYRHVWWAHSLRFQLPKDSHPTMDVYGKLIAALGLSDAAENGHMCATSIVDDDHVFHVSGLYWIHSDRYRAALIEASRTHR